MYVFLGILNQRLLRIFIQMIAIFMVGQDIALTIWFGLVFLLWFSDAFYFWELRKRLMMSSLRIRAKTAGPDGNIIVGRLMDVMKVTILCVAYVCWGWELWIIVPTIAYYLLIDFIIMRLNREIVEENLAGKPPANCYVDF